jgi:hypothetical protein
MPLTLTYNGLGGKVKFSGTSGKFKTTYIKPLLLSLYPGAAVAYSLRKISTSYTGSAIRVRRSNDNAEQNIGFVNDVLDTASLLTFCGANNGFVTTWYDQSGNANNAVQATAGIQARIVNAGAITYQNGKPVIDFYGNGIFYTYSPVIATGDLSLYIIQKRVGQSVILSSTSGGVYLGQQSDNNFYIQRVTGASGFYRASADSSTAFCILEGYTVSSVMSAYKNNTAYTLTGELAFGSTNTSYNSIGNYNGSAQSTGTVLEIIIYANNQTSNRTGINTNINSFYSIY